MAQRGAIPKATVGISTTASGSCSIGTWRGMARTITYECWPTGLKWRVRPLLSPRSDLDNFRGVKWDGNDHQFPASRAALPSSNGKRACRISQSRKSPRRCTQLTLGDTLVFGNVVVGNSSDLTFTVTNGGGEVFTGSVNVSAPFSIVSGGTINLGAGQTQTVTVRFSPTSLGQFSGTAAISSNGGSGKCCGFRSRSPTRRTTDCDKSRYLEFWQCHNGRVVIKPLP